MHSDLGYLVHRAARQMRLRLAARLAELNLRPQQGAVLMAIARSECGRLTPSQIAEYIDMDAPSTTGVLERLQRDGWVTSERNPEDGRSRLIALTERAAAVAPSVIAVAETVSHEATSGLTAGEVRTLGELLARVADHSTLDVVHEAGAE